VAVPALAHSGGGYIVIMRPGIGLHAVNKSKDVSVYIQSWDRRKTVQLFDLYVDDEKRGWATRGQGRAGGRYGNLGRSWEEA
jgi:hypothetical protein